jgi:uncharacterized protein YceH (UPF0502 family)
VDEDLKKFIEGTAAATRRQFEVIAERLESIESTAVETRRHFDVVAERLESKIDTVAEGVISANQRIDRLDAKVEQVAADVANEFNDVRSMIKFSHHDLDRRLRTLEDTVADLQGRVERLESSSTH